MSIDKLIKSNYVAIVIFLKKGVGVAFFNDPPVICFFPIFVIF